MEKKENGHVNHFILIEHGRGLRGPLEDFDKCFNTFVSAAVLVGSTTALSLEVYSIMKLNKK